MASTFQSTKLEIVAHLGVSKDALHIYVGLFVFFAAVAVLKKPLRSLVPLAVVIGISMFGEVLDARDDIASFGHWRIDASAHDVLNTVLWPTVIFVLARFTRILK